MVVMSLIRRAAAFDEAEVMPHHLSAVEPSGREGQQPEVANESLS